jgi:hypothetical protein
MALGADLGGDSDAGQGAPGTYTSDGGSTCLSTKPAGLYSYASIELISGSNVFGNLGLTDTAVFSSVPVADGKCTFVDTSVTPPPPPVTIHRYTESGGELTITGGSFPIGIVPDADSNYTFTSQSVVFAAGAQLSLDFAGACDVPPTHLSFTYPTPATLSAPPANATVPRASDLTVTWSTGQSGLLEAVISVGKYTLGCDFDIASGSGTIPKASLAQLPAGAATLVVTQSQFTVTSDNGRSFQIFGDAAIANNAITLQ